jgi:L-arabinose isomerase
MMGINSLANLRPPGSPGARVGVFGIGLETYWRQFEGLEQRLTGYLDGVAQRLQRPGVQVVNAGLVDTVDKAFAAGRRFQEAGVDLIFLYATTYALSSTVLPVVRRAKVPVVVLNLQPASAIDYSQFNRSGDRTRMTGEWLAWCGACPAPEIANVLLRAGLRFHQVTGTLEKDDPCWRQLDDWIEAARVAEILSGNRTGLLGRYYNGMLDIYTDVTRMAVTFGGHYEILEMDELAALRRAVAPAAIEERTALFGTHFQYEGNIDSAELDRAARTSVALDALVERHRLGAMAYYYESVPGHEHEDIIGSVILGCSLLIARGVSIAGEYEVKNSLAMKIMDAFGAGGSFTEFYVADFADDVVLMGHDGPGHIGIAEGKTRVRQLAVFHGKPGRGLSVEMSVRHGPVTLLSVMEDRDGGFCLLYAEGESVAGPILEIGNTNSRYRFPVGARGFIEGWNARGPAHHCAIGVGHIGSKIEKLAALLGIAVKQVC